MRLLVAIACIVAAASPALGAEEQPGLDLSQPPKKDAPKQEGEELPPLDLSKPAPPAGAKAGAKPQEEKPAYQPFSEQDVALGDKVKAVQRKGFLKRGRFEIQPLFAASLNDAVYKKLGYGLRLA